MSFFDRDSDLFTYRTKHPFTCFSTKELNKTERTQDGGKNVFVISDVKRQNCFS